MGVASEEGEEEVRRALDRAMRAIFGGAAEEVHLLAYMMGVRSGREALRLGRLSPEGLQRATFGAIRAMATRLAARGPTVLALEDLHWADPTSLRLTEELAALARDSPLLVIATRRPSPTPVFRLWRPLWRRAQPARCEGSSLRVCPRAPNASLHAPWSAKRQATKS